VGKFLERSVRRNPDGPKLSRQTPVFGKRGRKKELLEKKRKTSARKKRGGPALDKKRANRLTRKNKEEITPKVESKKEWNQMTRLRPCQNK